MIKLPLGSIQALVVDEKQDCWEVACLKDAKKAAARRSVNALALLLTPAEVGFKLSLCVKDKYLLIQHLDWEACLIRWTLK